MSEDKVEGAVDDHDVEVGGDDPQSSLKQGGHGGGGHGEALQHAREQGGGDAEGARHQRRRCEPESFHFRLLEAFRFCSSVLEPDFHLEMSPFQSMYHRFPRRMKKIRSSPVSR